MAEQFSLSYMRWYYLVLLLVATIVTYASSLALTSTKHQHTFAFEHHSHHILHHPRRRARTSVSKSRCCKHNSILKSYHNFDIIEKDTATDDEDTSSQQKQQLQFVAKTIESFKLADLYWLESCVMARDLDSGGRVDRLAFHRPTASCLLGYNNEDFNRKKIELPFRACRSQYVAKVLASGKSPQELLDNIQHIITVDDVQSQWIIEYDTFEPLQNKSQPKKKSFSSTMIMCAVSRLIPGGPCLNPSYSDEGTTMKEYIIIETKHRLYLVEKLSEKDASLRKEVSSSSTKQIAKQFKDAWSKRPFQYSGAINLDVAFVLIDILSDILHIDDKTDKPIRMLDPTCGSGAFLALALKAWGDQVDVEVVGIDSNVKCAEGTIRNLMHICANAVAQAEEEDNVWALAVEESKATIHAKNSVQLSTFISDKFDCAVANLPWNRNTFEYNEGKNTVECTNSGILEATAATLKTGSPLIAVSGRDNEQDELGSSFNTRNCLENLGFRIVGEATIPPKGYALPSSSKKTGGMKKKGVQSRSSDCLITVAISPQR